MIIAAATEKMIAFSRGNLHDICHFLKVHAYARTIGTLENLDPDTQLTLELAAIVHDIAIPLCREKYGSAAGPLQEKEGPALARAFLQDFDLPLQVIDRVAQLVGRHHTYTDVDGADCRILLEADYLVNADEGRHDRESVLRMRECCFRTAAALRLLDDMYLTDR